MGRVDFHFKVIVHVGLLRFRHFQHFFERMLIISVRFNLQILARAVVFIETSFWQDDILLNGERAQGK